MPDLSRLSGLAAAPTRGVIPEPTDPVPAGPLARLSEYMTNRVAQAGQMTQGPFHAPGGIDQAAGGSMGLMGTMKIPGSDLGAAKFVTVTSNGKQYQIPEMWLMARVRMLGGSPKTAYPQAINSWIAQEEMARSLGQ